MGARPAALGFLPVARGSDTGGFSFFFSESSSINQLTVAPLEYYSRQCVARMHNRAIYTKLV